MLHPLVISSQTEAITNPLAFFFFFKYLLIYLFYLVFWLHWVFVAARGLLSSCGVWVFSLSCGVRAPGRMGSVVCGTRALVMARELSSCFAAPRHVGS